MLDEVARAVQRLGLVAAAHPRVDGDLHALGLRLLQRHHLDAVAQRRCSQRVQHGLRVQQTLGLLWPERVVRRFQNQGDAREARVARDRQEGRPAQIPLAQGFMAVVVRGQGLLRVVQVHPAQVAQAHGLVHPLEEGLQARLRGQVEARAVGMGRVQADADARLVLHPRDDAPQLLRLRAQVGALAGGVLDDYRLGNIRENSFDQLDEKRRSIKFIEESMSLPEDCQACSVRPLCRGGCKRDRENFAEGRIEKTYLCSAYRQFFTSNMEKLMEIVKAEHFARNGRTF